MLRLLPLAAFALFVAAPVRAQAVGAETPLRPTTRALALTDARVVVSPGRVLDRATVLVRDGRIEAVGRGLRVPFDAEVVPADSFTVYAGFVDAFSTAGVAADPPPTGAYEGDRGAPPRERAGLRPERDVRAAFDPAEGRVAALRAQGFGAAHVAPREGALSGQGAVALLRPASRFESPSELFLTGTATSVVRLTPAQGVYPSTVMGVLAVLRESVENARRNRPLADASARGGAAQPLRPRFAPLTDALGPVIDGRQRLVIVAPSPLDGFRAIRAAEEMALPLVLAGVSDAAPLAARLRPARGSGPRPDVIATLALPDTVAVDSLARAVRLPGTTGGLAGVAVGRALTPPDLAAERARLQAARAASVARAEASPAALAAAGVPFAFGTFDVAPDRILPNLRRMVAAGLAPDAALAALTTAPAALLGLGALLGTVEPGRIANLVVVRGDLFADTAAVRHVVVEGVRFAGAGRARRATAADSAAGPADPLGTWAYAVDTPDGVFRGTFTLTGSTTSLAGTITALDRTGPLTSASLSGRTLTLRFPSPQGPPATMTGVVSGDSFEGTVEIADLGEFPVTATRQPE